MELKLGGGRHHEALLECGFVVEELVSLEELSFFQFASCLTWLSLLSHFALFDSLDQFTSTDLVGFPTPA